MEREQIVALLSENKRLRETLQMAGIRLGILVGRMQACHEDTGNHELMDEAVMFWTEARDATEKMPPPPAAGDGSEAGA